MHYDHMPEGQADDPGTQDPHMLVQCQAAA
jgi:hypothetical protein